MAEEKIAVPTKDCMGMDVGLHGVPIASYPAQDGFVTVENPHHKTMLKSMGGGVKNYGFSGRTAAPDVTCSGCGRRQFLAFGLICTFCGGTCI